MTPTEQTVEPRVRAHVAMLAGTIGPRHVGRPGALAEARDYIVTSLSASGYTPRLQEYDAGGVRVANIEAELAAGAAAPLVVVGAHYDSVPGSPGADDNASGVAVLLEAARLARQAPRRSPVRFVAFVNEEPPWFRTALMGSSVYAAGVKARGDAVRGMISLESVGYYSDAPHSQQYPRPFDLFFPATGDFLAAVSNFRSWALLRQITRDFRRGSALPVIGSPAPERIAGVGWSDHWPFWERRYRAVMLTGTAVFRNPHYHRASDTPDTLDYGRLARVVSGVDAAVAALADGR